MKKSALFALALALLCAGVVSSSHAQNDWIILIDGTNGMENFNVVGGANWSATDGTIQSTGEAGGFLVTRESYGNFLLTVEFWVSDDANSGIYMRCQDATTITDRSCYEANIFDQRPDLTFGTGGIVHIAPVAEPFPKAGGKWNTYQITMDGEHMTVVLNGVQTVHAMDSQFASGPIALQWARGTVRFRNVRIQPL
ncbi:MAG: DUF1080 domain-containing protein [Gammaproteobacteria bacterium]|nr:DUF1080 domain-containing protein [Gammaproteobacteria bacterium]MDP2140675.1 DUF1080 domain-containing protein [Gammaproteobacteria bacterium]MDP2346934.1 DUF1080 domain-containing protein [Gammaproteobacteria bacterium]